jgi:hypothetical protein
MQWGFITGQGGKGTPIWVNSCLLEEVERSQCGHEYPARRYADKNATRRRNRQFKRDARR